MDTGEFLNPWFVSFPYGYVLCAHCTCALGSNEMCIHIGGLLHKVHLLKVETGMRDPSSQLVKQCNENDRNQKAEISLQKDEDDENTTVITFEDQLPLSLFTSQKQRKRIKLFVCGICSCQFRDKRKFKYHCHTKHALIADLTDSNFQKRANSSSSSSDEEKTQELLKRRNSLLIISDNSNNSDHCLLTENCTNDNETVNGYASLSPPLAMLSPEIIVNTESSSDILPLPSPSPPIVTIETENLNNITTDDISFIHVNGFVESLCGSNDVTVIDDFNEISVGCCDDIIPIVPPLTPPLSKSPTNTYISGIANKSEFIDFTCLVPVKEEPEFIIIDDDDL